MLFRSDSSIEQHPVRLSPHRQHQLNEALADLSHTFRNIPDVPAAHQFSEDMKAAIAHTQLILQAARQRMVRQTDKKRTISDTFKDGDKVMLSTKDITIQHQGCNKLLPQYVGPFTITQTINPVAFRLNLPDTMRIHDVFHASRLKPYKERPGSNIEPPPLIIDGAAEFVVEKILGHRPKTVSTKKTKHVTKRKQRLEYLVKWEGYDAHHNQWIAAKELARHCQEAIADYHRETQTKPPQTDRDYNVTVTEAAHQ